MKISQLETIIRKLIKEELKQMLPMMLSEMYVKRIVSEHVEAPVQRQQRQVPAPIQKTKQHSNLAKKLMEEYENDSVDWYGSQEEEPEPIVRNVAQKARALASSGPLGGMLAEMIDEDTISSLSDGMASPSMTEMQGLNERGIPLEQVETAAPGFDFSRMRQIAQVAEQRATGAQKRDASSEERRIEMQRKMLDAKVING